MENTKECHSLTTAAGDISIWHNVEAPLILRGPKAEWASEQCYCGHTCYPSIMITWQHIYVPHM